MPGALEQVLTWVAIPVLAAIAGGIVPIFYEPGPRLRSSVQHFAAGLVFAAVSAELLPKILDAHSLVATAIGFALGVLLMLTLKWVSRQRKLTGSKATAEHSLVLAAGVDYIVDGLLIGIGFVLGAKSGGLLTFALSAEGMFLAMGVASALIKSKAEPLRIAITSVIFGSLFAVGAITGAVLFDGLSGPTHAAILAFGSAALIYLVTEELLVEAHDDHLPEDPVTVALFFAGFLLLISIEMSL